MVRRLHLNRRSLLAVVAIGVLGGGAAFAAFASRASDTVVASPTTTTTTRPPPTEPPSTAPATTTTSAATTTTVLQGPIAPLTGLVVVDESALDRRVVGIKIDNHPLARPQSGLAEAEAVYEVVVEGGLTRFLALFHTTDSDYLGPMRSGRPTDAALMKPLGGTFAISGSSFWIGRYLVRQGIDMVSGGAGAFRISSRSAPHNLYVDTAVVRTIATVRGHPDEPPPMLWDFGSLPESAVEADTVTMVFSDAIRATWTWTGAGYERSTNGKPHMLIDRDEVETPLTFDGVIVLRVDQYVARPPKPSDGVAVPASNTVGSGRAVVFVEGKVVEGFWQRDSVSDVFHLETESGEVLEIPPGRYWIALVPNRGSVDWS